MEERLSTGWTDSERSWWTALTASGWRPALTLTLARLGGELTSADSSTSLTSSSPPLRVYLVCSAHYTQCTRHLCLWLDRIMHTVHTTFAFLVRQNHAHSAYDICVSAWLDRIMHTVHTTLVSLVRQNHVHSAYGICVSAWLDKIMHTVYTPFVSLVRQNHVHSAHDICVSAWLDRIMNTVHMTIASLVRRNHEHSAHDTCVYG